MRLLVDKCQKNELSSNNLLILIDYWWISAEKYEFSTNNCFRTTLWFCASSLESRTWRIALCISPLIGMVLAIMPTKTKERLLFVSK